jgi:hypothetical protein
MDDDGHGIALFMRLLAGFALRYRMVERSRFQTFAARLLPELSMLISAYSWEVVGRESDFPDLGER